MKSLQNKKNLKDRANKLFNHLRNNTNYKMAMKYTGSLAEKGPVKPRTDGSYDLDIDILSKFEENADIVYGKLQKIINEAIRFKEVKKNKERVTYIGIEEDGHKYNLDIAFLKLEKGEPKKILIMDRIPS